MMTGTLPAPTPIAGVPLMDGAAHIVLRAGDDDEVGGLHQRLGHVLGDRRRKDLHQVRRQADLLQLGAHEIDRALGGP